MTPLVFPKSLPSMYYSLKITNTIVIIFYNIVMDVIVMYLTLISYCRNEKTDYSQLT